MDEYPVPGWLKAELAANHPGIEIRWMPYGERKEFVLPLVGDAFHRMPARKLNNTVMYRRYITPDSPPKWRLHPLTYFPESDKVTTGRFVVFQTNAVRGEVVKLFDCVNDDGSLHPLDRRVVEAIQRRDGKFGAQEKAIADVEAAPERGGDVAGYNLTEATGDLFERIHHDVLKHASENACVPPEDDEDSLEIVTG